MKTDHKIIIGVVLLTLVIIIGGAWLSNNKAIEVQAKLAKKAKRDKQAQKEGR